VQAINAAVSEEVQEDKLVCQVLPQRQRFGDVEPLDALSQIRHRLHFGMDDLPNVLLDQLDFILL